MAGGTAVNPPQRLNAVACFRSPQEAPDDENGQNEASANRKHHLLRYELTEDACQTARDHFAGLSTQEAGNAIWELQ